MSRPKDPALYAAVKRDVFARNPTNSAYRSGHLVQEYKRRFAEEYGPDEPPYHGPNPSRRGLSRWFREKWRNQRGTVGYEYKGDVYRPTVRVSSRTPATFAELTPGELRRARREKAATGVVRRFQTGGGSGPNLTPRQMFALGSFGGTYWRPISSGVTGKSYRNVHKAFPAEWWEGIPEDHLTRPFDRYDKAINRYGVRVGTTLEFWESKGWICKYDPYGWVQWYCNYCAGRVRPGEDERQIKRWERLAGPNGRFRRALISLILKKGAAWDDEAVSPKIRQTLQHWGYRLTRADFEADLKRRGLLT